MTLGVDARTTRNQYKGRGIGNYTRHIIEWLPRVDSSIEIETRDFSRADVFLQPNFWDGFPVRLWRIAVPKVLMVHDLTPLATNRFSEKGVLANFLKGLLYRWKLRNVRKADAILVNSENTKKDVIKYVGVAPEIIHRVYLGVDEEFRVSEEEVARREERGNYILFVGGAETNKNMLRLLEAFKRVQSAKCKVQSQVQSSKLNLVITGGQFVDEKKVETKMIKAKVKELGLENNVEFPGFVEQKDLVKLYRHAMVFVYPSYYEGFGFPVLEAMACGTPVVTSNVPPLTEVAGDAAILVNPYNVESIAEGIKKVLHFHTLEYGKYQQLVQRGLQQSEKFSWQKCARGTLEVLRSVLE